MQRFFRGQVWWSKPPKINSEDFTPEQRKELFGSIQQGIRPVIIVSNDVGNKNSSTLQVVPCTTAKKNPLPTHCCVVIDGNINTVLCEQLKTVKKSEVFNYVGALDSFELKELDRCLKVSLGLLDNSKKYKVPEDLEKELENLKNLEE